MNIINNKNLIYSILSGTFIGIAWLFPNTIYCAILGFLSAIYFVLLLKNDAKVFYFFLSGLILNSIGFYWLYFTIHDFGQFSTPLSLIGFLLFAILSSIQFLFPPLIYKVLNKSSVLSCISLQATLSFVVIESFFPKFFPWSFAHTTLFFKSLSLNASIFGTQFLSFFIFWICEFFVDFTFFSSNKRLYKRPSFIPIIVFTILLINGNCINQKKYDYKKTKVTVVQAVPTTELVEGMQIIKADVYKYYNLTKDYIKNIDSSLIIWPESVITNLIPENVGNVKTNFKLPYFGNNYPLITGALSYNDNQQVFNSIFFVGKDAQVPFPYHKQVLIPFGEYIPLVDYFPFLKKLTKLEGFFDRGTRTRIFTYSDKNNYLVKVSPFICYEELVPRLTLEAVKKGANLLVGVSNDGWFGKGVALNQHNMISSFRAIETNRFLIRSTHTGLTSIIDNKGNLVDSFPIYQDFIKSYDIPLIENQTIYSKFKDILLILLNISTFLIFLINFFKKSEYPNKK